MQLQFTCVGEGLLIHSVAVLIYVGGISWSGDVGKCFYSKVTA